MSYELIYCRTEFDAGVNESNFTDGCFRGSDSSVIKLIALGDNKVISTLLTIKSKRDILPPKLCGRNVIDHILDIQNYQHPKLYTHKL